MKFTVREMIDTVRREPTRSGAVSNLEAQMLYAAAALLEELLREHMDWEVDTHNIEYNKYMEG